MPPLAAVGAGLAGAAGSAAGAIGGAVGGIGSALGGAGGLSGALGTIGSLGQTLGGLGGGGGSSAGADPLALYNAQVQQAQLANLARQGISNDYFGDLIGNRAKPWQLEQNADKSQQWKNRQKKQYRKDKKNFRYGNDNKLLFGEQAGDVFGERPNYYEVDFQPFLEQDPGLANTARDVTEGNLRNFDVNSALSEAVNAFLTRDAKNRVSSFDPYLLGGIEETGRNALLASRGILPGSDREDIIRNRNESTGVYGTAGTSRGQVAKDLGLSQLNLQSQVAPGMMGQNAALINSIAPPQLRDDPRSYQVDTAQALQIGAADNQFEATFDRNEQNLRSMLESMPDPVAQGLFNLKNTLRAQQFSIDFGLGGGYGVPGTMPDNLGGETGGMQFLQAGQGVGNIFESVVGSLGGGGMGTPGIFG